MTFEALQNDERDEQYDDEIEAYYDEVDPQACLKCGLYSDRYYLEGHDGLCHCCRKL